MLGSSFYQFHSLLGKVKYFGFLFAFGGQRCKWSPPVGRGMDNGYLVLWLGLHHPSKVSLLPRAPPCLSKSSVPTTWKQRCSSLLHIWEGEAQQEGRCAVIEGPHCTPRSTLPVSSSPSCSRLFHNLFRKISASLPHCLISVCTMGCVPSAFPLTCLLPSFRDSSLSLDQRGFSLFPL